MNWNEGLLTSNCVKKQSKGWILEFEDFAMLGLLTKS